MNIFTKDDYRKIQAWLKANSIKDSDLTSVNDTIPEEDTLVLVQKINGILSNVKISIKNLLNSTLSKIIIDTIIANAVKINNTLTVTASKVKIDNEKGTTLQDIIDWTETIEKAAKGWNIEYQVPSIDEPTVRAKYVLKDSKGVPKGDVIKVYKDSAITNVYLGTVEDTCNPNTGEVTKNPIHDNNEALSIVYRLDTDKYSLVNVPIKMFATEAEFDKYRGLGVTSNGQIFIKLASDVESSNYLHFNELGEITADGIETRILRDLGNIITSIAGDGTMWGQYKKEEGTKESQINEASRWGQYKQAEAKRSELLNTVSSKINTLENKIDSLALGAFYGYFPDSESLPIDVKTSGYAYVGLDNPYEIWNFNGESWIDSGTSIDMNDADEEDITRNIDGKLQFKDKEYGDGMGYVILRKNKSFAEQVTKENTIYEIRYDFNLNGESVTIPANCVLKFDGGRIENGTLVGNRTTIKAELIKIFGEDIIIIGEWDVSTAYSEWFSKEATYQNKVISNLAKLSKFIRLEPIIFNIEKNGTLSIVVSEINGYGATMSFDDGSDSSGNNLKGLILNGINVKVKGISFSENFIVGSTNDDTIGSMIISGNTTRLSFEDCTFEGTFSSSCFAASTLSYFHAKNIKADNCICADHIFYCSTKIKEYILENIECNNSKGRDSLFKVRDSEYFKLYKVDGLRALNSQNDAYIFGIHPLDSNESAIIYFNNIVIERQNNSGMFCLLGNGVVSQIFLKNSRLINSISSRKSIFWEGSSRSSTRISIIEISNCFIQGLTLGYQDANTYIYSSEVHEWTGSITTRNAKFNATNCIFKNSNSSQALFSYIKYISLNNCDIIAPLTYLIDKRYDSNENAIYSIFNCNIKTLSRNIFLADNTTKQFYYSCDSNISANPNYALVTGGEGNALILNAKSGKFRPILTPLDKGYQFYDTNLSPNKPIWYNGTYWVDVLGTRVTWPITFILTNISASNMRQPTTGVSYTTKLSAASEYNLPSSITVKMGSATLSSGTDYTYDTSTGEIVILGSGGVGGVTDSLTITASGVFPSINN